MTEVQNLVIDVCCTWDDGAVAACEVVLDIANHAAGDGARTIALAVEGTPTDDGARTRLRRSLHLALDAALADVLIDDDLAPVVEQVVGRLFAPWPPSDPRHAAERALHALVTAGGGPAGHRSIPIGHLDSLGALLEAWAREHGTPVEGGVRFSGRPGFWHAFQDLCPIDETARWEGLRKAVLDDRRRHGWVPLNKTKAPASFIPTRQQR